MVVKHGDDYHGTIRKIKHLFQIQVPSKWPFDSPNGGHLTTERVT